MAAAGYAGSREARVFGLDEAIAGLGNGELVLVTLAAAVLLGLRHATDPDHLTAVATLILSEPDAHAAGRARALGLAWGLGHATTLFALGLPVVLFGRLLPPRVAQVAEVLIGIVIMALAARLLWRWRNGGLHSHEHRHDGRAHSHPHAHVHPHHDRAGAHRHGHDDALGRSPREAYGVGLVHGVGGSAGVALLLLAGIEDQAAGLAALALFALFTAVSMAVASTLAGWGLARRGVRRRLRALTPVLGSLSLSFGAWYSLGAVGALPYPF